MKPIMRSVRTRLLGGILLSSLATAVWLIDRTQAPAPNQATIDRDEEISLSALPPGAIRVLPEPSGLWSVVSNDAPLGAILLKTSEAAHFILKAEPLRNHRLSVRLEGKTLEQIFQELLRGYSYRPEYRYDLASERHTLSMLEVGTTGPFTLAPSETGDRKAAAPARKSSRTEPPDPSDPILASEPELLMAEHLGNQLRDRGQLSDAFEGTWEHRLEAVTNTLPSGDGVHNLARSLKDDPDPRVRVAAAKQLAYGGGRSATGALLAALKDEDQLVVMGALASLVQSGDPAVGAKIQEIAQSYPDGDLRNSLIATAARLASTATTEADGATSSSEPAQ